jgi:hypothetical protein
LREECDISSKIIKFAMIMLTRLPDVGDIPCGVYFIEGGFGARSEV